MFQRPTIWTKYGATWTTTSAKVNVTHSCKTILTKQQDGRAEKDHLQRKTLTFSRTISTKAKATEANPSHNNSYDAGHQCFVRVYEKSAAWVDH